MPKITNPKQLAASLHEAMSNAPICVTIGHDLWPSRAAIAGLAQGGSSSHGSVPSCDNVQ